MQKTRKIKEILEKAKGTKNITNIKSVKKRILISKVKNKKEKLSKRDKGLPMFLRNSTKNYIKAKMNKSMKTL